MAAVLNPSFPHNILHNAIDTPSFVRDRHSPPRPSLPSISSLIRDIDEQSEKSPARSPISDQRRRKSGGSYTPATPDTVSLVGSPRNRLPPTPPLPGTSSFDFPPRSGRTSPMTSTNPPSSYFSGSPTTTNPESYATRKSSYPPIPETNHWSQPTSPASSRRPSDESSSIQGATRTTQASYPGPAKNPSPYSGLSQQRTLPANFPPTIPSPVSQNSPPIDPQMATSQYQHHHHYPSSSGSSYMQPTDRYQCPTCSKAFSRPSSLKIHSYSHTGEKPFRCKFEGCGKEFSVRSNMKRHEKGCHGIETSSNGGNSPKAN